ncbi:hypothetical protein, partial [Sphingobacterium sp. T2]|uniref:hypothetical protein n=1 Tax=Sphingobacterium sp. T2 TaxID=1590596 RepID=UPI001E313412
FLHQTRDNLFRYPSKVSQISPSFCNLDFNAATELDDSPAQRSRHISKHTRVYYYSNKIITWYNKI